MGHLSPIFGTIKQGLADFALQSLGGWRSLVKMQILIQELRDPAFQGSFRMTLVVPVRGPHCEYTARL